MALPFPSHGASFDSADADGIAELLRRIADGRETFFPQPEQDWFIAALRPFVGAAGVVPMSSCGAALDSAMALLGIGPGDEVITTGLTFAATSGSILLRGARPRFADIDPLTLNLVPEHVRALVTERTRAIVPVHFAGLMCDVDAFDAITRATGIPVIYDAAHALGATRGGRTVGDCGLASCLSFQFNKHVTCLGEGGALLSLDPALTAEADRFKSFGFQYPRPDSHDGGVVTAAGTNFQMNKIQFAAGLLQLGRLAEVLDRRRAVFRTLHEALSEIAEIELHGTDDPGHACLLFVVRTDPSRSGLAGGEMRRELARRGIETRHHYTPVWQWPLYRSGGYDGAECPATERIAPNLLTLPLSARTAASDCRHIADTLKSIIARHRPIVPVASGPSALRRREANHP